VSFSYIEWLNSNTEHFTKSKVPHNNLFDKEYNSEAPINRFRILSKYINGGISRDRVLQENLDTEEDAYALQFYIKEDPRVFLSTPTTKSGSINKIKYQPTQIFDAQKLIVYKSPGKKHLHN
jgi:hypothetical protein